MAAPLCPSDFSLRQNTHESHVSQSGFEETPFREKKSQRLNQPKSHKKGKKKSSVQPQKILTEDLFNQLISLDQGSREETRNAILNHLVQHLPWDYQFKHQYNLTLEGRREMLSGTVDNFLTKIMEIDDPELVQEAYFNMVDRLFKKSLNKKG
jgi:hypothetical protein